jgi:hypothetical protein
MSRGEVYISRELKGKRDELKAVEHVQQVISKVEAVGMVRLFSVRHEFPTEWAMFQSRTPGANQRYELALNLGPEHYPFWSIGRLEALKQVELFVRKEVDVRYESGGGVKQGTLKTDPSLGGMLRAQLADVQLKQPDGKLAAKPTGELRLFLDDKALGDLWIAVTWSG